MREALATAAPDLVRQEPGARSSRRPVRSPPSRSWRRGHGIQRGKRYLALFGGVILAAAILGILANALLLQRTRHPAPLLGKPAPVAKAASAHVSARPPRAEVPPLAVAPSPVPAPERASSAKPAIEAPPVAKPRQPIAVAPVAAKPSDPIGQMLRTSGHEPRPAAAVERRPVPPVERRPKAAVERRPTAKVERRPAPSAQTRPGSVATSRPAPAPSRAVAAAQRALVKLGFVLEADGVAGATTRKAIERYERDRGLPARGVLSPDLARRLGSEAGVAIE